jgi:hypothetical protein
MELTIQSILQYEYILRNILLLVLDLSSNSTIRDEEEDC